jgi:hypothetical protein
MPKKYRSGFERLSRLYPETDIRYATALQAVRENFTGFGVKDGYRKQRPLSESQRRQIRRYYNLLSEYTEGAPVYKMTPAELPWAIKKGGRYSVEQVMKAAQMPQGRKRAKYIFIKYDGETIPKVRVKNGVPVFVNDRFGYEKEVIELNKIALATDPIGTIRAIAPLTEGARFYRIVNGRHEFYNAADLETLGKKVQQLQQKYAVGTPDSWKRWLYGVAAYYSDALNAAQIINHQTESKRAFKERIQREARRVREKRK